MDETPDHHDPFERDDWLAEMEAAREDEASTETPRARWGHD